MAPVAPPILVGAPALNGPKFGLLSAVELVTPEDSHFVNGVEQTHNPLPGANARANDCQTGPGTPIVLPEGMPTVESGPITVWSGFECKHTGLTREEIDQYARTKLAISEGPFVERELWANADTPFMESTIVTPAGTTALPLLEAVGAMEKWLYGNYGGTGVLHIGREHAPALDAVQQIDYTSTKASTKLGTSVVFGNYPGTGPDGDPAAAGQSWVVVTGQLQARRGDVQVHTGGSAYFDPSTNKVIGLAERTYVVTWDAVKAAFLVDWKG